ncbi:hypothetical protein [Methanolobus sp. WCC4]|uniref:hypothetical protein n=1 Tax=Methanolobus sp. WCC4 TaxID=3125784 RepID=UPI0030F9E12B
MSRVQQYIDKKIANYLMKRVSTTRPGIGHHESYAAGNIAPSLGLAYYLENEVSVFSDSVLKLKQEMFRNGFRWDNADEDSTDEIDYTEIEKLDRFIKKANYNGQSLKEVLSDFEFNLNVADNGYLLLVKAYDYDRFGEIALEDVKEILSIDPRDIKKMVKKDGRMGGNVWICPTHRDVKKGVAGHKCYCGAVLQQAYYETTSNENKQYYLKDEVLYSAKFYPSILYGFPPALKMLDDLMAYHFLEKRTRSYYERGRPPGIVMIPTNNQDSLRGSPRVLVFH